VEIHRSGADVDKGRTKTLATIAFVSCTALTHAGIIFVDDDAPQGGNGTSWSTAFQSIYAALAVAQNNDEIRIAQGTYTAGSGPFVVTRPLVIQGGFAGVTGPGDPDTYDPQLFRTILTGDVQGNDGPNFTNRADNADTVLHATSASTLTLMAVRIESGRVYGVLAPTEFLAAEVVFRWNQTGVSGGSSWSHCVFEDNERGLLTGASATLLDCQFRGCILRGAEFSDSQSRSLFGCTFENNGTTTLTEHGGAIWATATLSLADCEFTSNASWSTGGAVAYTGSGGFVIDRCRFDGNSSAVGGAVSGNGAITASTFFDNLAAGALGAQGGAVQGIFAIADSLFVRNTCSGDGGAVYLAGGGPLTNCTFADNLAVFYGGAVHAASGTSAVRNCIAWSNTAALGSQLAVTDGATLRVAFSTIESGTAGAYADDDADLLWGLGNRSANPLFANVADDDYRLTAASPCIDAAENYVVTSQLDLAGLPRFVDTPAVPDTGLGDPPIVDMGAYEFQATDPTPTCDGDVNNDRVVNLQDLAVLLSNFGLTGSATPAQGDLNGDQDVDISDLALLLAHFGTTCD
jgi:hypothetical protein